MMTTILTASPAPGPPGNLTEEKRRVPGANVDRLDLTNRITTACNVWFEHASMRVTELARSEKEVDAVNSRQAWHPGERQPAARVHNSCACSCFPASIAHSAGVRPASSSRSEGDPACSSRSSTAEFGPMAAKWIGRPPP